MAKYFTALFVALASLQAASANPLGARAEVAEVIPGDGLPSLESLGLTSADLYAMGLPATPGDEMSVMFDARCGPSDGAYTNVNGIIACYNYLRNLGTTNCGVKGPGAPVTEFCRSGDAHATGQSITGNDESSYCRDVAAGLLWVINSCTRPQQDCAGFNAASGNGNLVVGGTNIRW
ncbi:hypothetical protein EK21DRAFT_95076 [Setomelanomma holmii]|uniref:Uncharacterized protein n=1 Tax=Setomelanomma holmii TaxID=210430 RepID=A0A9P4LGJ0_9PLEO|nr:hypothetical protein EK21DRAFT_95076 [Setomelanomma holmii]